MSTSNPSVVATPAERGRVLGACPAGVWVISGDDRTLLANEALVRLLGTSPSELLASSARRFFDPADAEVADELLHDPGPATHARTLRLRRGDGQLVRVVATGAPWTQGTRGGIVLALTPTMVSMHGLEQIRKRERQFREAERLGHLGSWEWEVQTGRLTFSDELYRIFGIEPSIVEPTLESVVERTVPADRAYFVGVVEEIAAGTRDLPFERRIHRPDGDVRTLHSNSRVIETDPDGRPLRVLGVCRDVTSERDAIERGRRFRELYEGERQVSDRLRQLDDLKFAFMSSVSHDLREPLATVMERAATLRGLDATLDPDATRLLLDQTIEHAQRLDSLLSDLLDLERLRRGTVEGVFRPVAIGELLRATLADVAGDDRLVVDLPHPDIVVEIDPPKVERVFENLARIALRNSPQGAPVHVRIRPVDGVVRIDVTDVGPRLPDEAKPRAFEPFASGAPDDLQAASGLSRAIVGRYVRLHSGRVWIEDAPGAGSRTTVELPVRQAPATAPPATPVGDAAVAPTMSADPSPAMSSRRRP